MALMPADGPRAPGARACTAVIIAATVLALLLRVYWLTRPGMLLGSPEYDDGVYLGSAVRLVDGALPYRDFAFMSPPGIALLMTPFGLLAKATSTATAMAAARVLMVCVGAASVPLAGRLVRHRGLLATTVACGLLAVHPAAVKASSTLFLEPWLVFLCLLGANAVFDGDAITEKRGRMVWGGVAIGFAVAIKLFPVLPAFALLVVVLASRVPRRAAQYVAGLVAGSCIPVLPFVLLAPSAFIHNVLLAQLHRTDVSRVRATSRLVQMLGLTYFPLGLQQLQIIAVVTAAVVAFCTLAAWWLSRSAPPPLDWFALGTAGLTAIAFMLPTDFYTHYAAFFVPFLALSLALSSARLVNVWTGSTARRPGLARVVTPIIAGCVAAWCVVMAVRGLNGEKTLVASSPAAAIDAHVPPGACVVTDDSSLTIVSSRFLSTVPGCTNMVDATATDMALGNGRMALTGAGRYPAVQSAWLDALHHAQYVSLSCGPPGARRCHSSSNRRIPWTPAILSYFVTHFRPVGHHSGALYVRTE
jgi:Glycosyltransferase family 87